ncbi:MAG: hypothetical protein B1H40_02970 [Candidatus Latescibacteria bacterium 4484_181]|nr:MAG: hypothetical protein B1H40_02970 [Candidatus Latescibacteria bacterium 4484_181]
MRKVWWLIPSLVVVLALVAVGCASQNHELAYSSSQSSQQNTGIWVTGTGMSMAIPDIAKITLGIEAQAETVTSAQTLATEAMDKVMQALQADGVAEKDIQTQRYSICPVIKWNGGEQTTTGYRVSNMVLVKLRDLDNAGSVIDDVVDAGGDLIRIQGITFTVDNPMPYYEAARVKAVQDAYAKAIQLADTSGVQLGKPSYISDSSIYWPYRNDFWGYKDQRASMPETAISPGELEVSVSVQIVYTIL